MIKCGNCGGIHETLEQCRLCSQGVQQPTMAPSSSAPYTPDMDRIVTTHCRKLSCKETFTGPLSEAKGWACSPEHGATEKTSNPAPTWVIGQKAMWNDKRFEILELSDDGQTIKLRTGGKGKFVPISELAPAQ